MIGTLLSCLPVGEVVHARSAAAIPNLTVAPALVIVDWPSESTDTVLLLHRIRNGELFDPDVPILALSSDMRQTVLEQIWQSGVNDIVGKPISAIEIISRSAALLDECWTWQPSAGIMAAQ